MVHYDHICPLRYNQPTFISRNGNHILTTLYKIFITNIHKNRSRFDVGLDFGYTHNKELGNVNIVLYIQIKLSSLILNRWTILSFLALKNVRQDDNVRSFVWRFVHSIARSCCDRRTFARPVAPED
jgi:hypothetical protein